MIHNKQTKRKPQKNQKTTKPKRFFYISLVARCYPTILYMRAEHYDQARQIEDGIGRREQERQGQRRALSVYDQWRLMQAVEAITPQSRGAHTRAGRRINAEQERIELCYLPERYEECKAIKRRRALAATIRRSARRRKQEKATKKALARHAQNTVRSKKAIQNVLSRKAPPGPITNINDFLGKRHYQQIGGKRRRSKRRSKN